MPAAPPAPCVRVTCGCTTARAVAPTAGRFFRSGGHVRPAAKRPSCDHGSRLVSSFLRLSLRHFRVSPLPVAWGRLRLRLSRLLFGPRAFTREPLTALPGLARGLVCARFNGAPASRSMGFSDLRLSLRSDGVGGTDLDR